MTLAPLRHRIDPWLRFARKAAAPACHALALSAATHAQEGPPAPPPPSTEFGSLVIRQNDELNTSTSMTMFRGPGGTLNWEPVWMSSSRADYFVTFFHENDFTAGTIIASVAENGRNNTAFGDGNIGIGPFRATVSVAATPTTGLPTSYRLATSGAFAPGPGDANGANGDEVNINTSFVYFPYHLWIAGNAWIFNRANGARVDRLTGTPGLELGTHLTNPANGRYELDLRPFDPEATSANGIVLVTHAKDEDNFASSIANADGTFTLRIKDNGSNGAGTEQDPVTFVYIPASKAGEENLLALGRVRNNGSSSVKAGQYSVAHAGTGTWHLTIPGNNPDTGTLVISGCGAGNMEDNIVSYQWNNAGYWVIQACDIINDTSLPVPENGASPWEEIFNFAFFAAPQIPQVTLTSPQQGQLFNGAADVTVTAEASDFNGTVERVQFFRNNRYLGEATEPPYEIIDSALEGGHYIYQARAIDNDGLAPYSTPVAVRVTYDPLNPPEHTALFFDGLTEHARTLEVEPALGVGGPPTRGFSLECWFRKEGAGATAGSGSGGITVHPLIAKGRGESDNNPSDCNYLFGVTMDGLIAADFEAYPTPGVVAGGANFPVYGTHEPIQNGRWYHGAVTYDGVQGVWKLYLDGELVGTRETVPGAMPRYDSNHAFAIGAAMNTSSQRAGSFFGAIDEVRIWNYTRTAEEIAGSKHASVPSAPGLVARFGLDEGTGEQITSSSGGTLAQVFGPGAVDDEEGGTELWEALWVPGAPLTNQAPSVALQTPRTGDVFQGSTPILIAAEAADLDGEVAHVRFYDGDALLAEVTAAPYQFAWSGAALGSRRLRAEATDDAGAISVDDAFITVAQPRSLLLTEVQSSQSAGAPAGVGDYWELTHFGAETVSLAGYTWHDSGRNRQAALAWALPAGTSLAAGESVIFTTTDPALFRAWWGLPADTRVIQSAGAPGLGQNDGIALYDEVGNEVFYFSYAPGGFSRADGLPALGGHAGASGGGRSSDALVWDPNSGVANPRYLAAGAGVNGGVTAAQGEDVGSPGASGGSGVDPSVLLVMAVTPAVFSESAANPAATGMVTRYGEVTEDLLVFLVSGDESEARVPVSVTIPAGEASATFEVTAVDDIQADGDQQVLLAATAANASLATFTVTVLDDGDLPPPPLLLTEVQSSQSGAPGAADYFEITNYGPTAVDMEGFTWDDDSRSYASGLAWAFPAGTSLAAGESVVVTTADPAAFRAWWGLDESVQVIQTPGAPGLGQNDGVALFDNTGRELSYLSYAAGGFMRPDGSPAAGGHAGVSGGGAETDALVWDPASGVTTPRYAAAQAGVLGAFQAANEAADVGSPGVSALDSARPFTLQLLHFSDAQGSELALETAPLLAAMVEAFEMEHDHTLVVAGGDTFIPGAFLYAGADPLLDEVPSIGSTALGRPDIAIHNLIGVEVSAIGAREWDLGSAVFMGAIGGAGDWAGADFPFLSVNLDYTADQAALARFAAVPLDGTATPVPLAGDLKGRLAPVTVVEKGGERIGVVAATSQRLAALSSPTGTVASGASADNLALLASQIQSYVDELLDEGINKIVLVSHLRDLTLEQALAGRLRGVDIIVAAGSHARLGDASDTPAAFPGHAANFAGSYPLLAQDQLGEPMLIVSTDSEFTYLGRLLVDFDAHGRIIEGSLPAYAALAGAYAATTANAAAAWGTTAGNLEATAFQPGGKGAAVREVTAALRAVLEAKDRPVYGFTAVHLEGEFSQARGGETNLGNLTSDANLEALRGAFAGGGAPLVSLQSGSGLTGPIGMVLEDLDGNALKRAPAGSVALGKPAGGVSQLDVENALRFNHRLMTFETTPQGLKEMLEHGVAAWPNQGRFPQVGGLLFAFDPARPAGDRITSIALLNEDGSAGAALYKAGPLAAAMLAQAPPLLRVVTLNFLANGGDGYPMKTHGENFRYLLADGTLGPVIADKALDFTAAPQQPGNAAGEQAALAAYLQARHGSLGLAYLQADTAYALDTRIQNLRFRADSVPPLAETDSDGDGLSDLDELLMGGNPFAALRVGDCVDLDLSPWMQNGRSLRLLGRLPAGLRFEAATGRLRGIITGGSGYYDLQLQILENGRVVETVALALAPGAFPSRLLANYEALLETDEGLPAGLVRLGLSKAGSWSGSAQLAGQPRRAAKGGFSLIPGEQRARVEMVFKATKALPELKVTLTIDAGSALVEGAHAESLAPAVTGGARGLRLAGFGASPPVTRRLNLAFDAGAQDGVAYPAGYGWVRGTVNKSGAVALKGQLGDAHTVTLAMRLGVNGQALIWVQPYRDKTSYLGGVADLPDLGQALPMAQRLAPGARWFKAADARAKAYADGFAEPLEVTVLGSAFLPVKNAAELEAALGLSTSILQVEIEGGGLSNIPGAEPELMASWTLAPNFALVSNTLSAAPWKGRLGKADGGLSGTLTLPAGAENLAGKAAVSGVLLPDFAGAGSAGAGLVRVPVAGAKGAFRTASLILRR